MYILIKVIYSTILMYLKYTGAVVFHYITIMVKALKLFSVHCFRMISGLINY